MKVLGILAQDLVIFQLEKTDLPENILFYINQGYQSLKDGKKSLL